MVDLPRMVAPPPYLLPAEVQAAFRRRRQWTTRSTLFFVGWVGGLVAGLLPISVLLLRHGVASLLGLGLALYLALPLGWLVARRSRSTRRQADHRLVMHWSRFPDDPRWSASLVLAQQMDQTSGADPEVRVVLCRLLETLFGLFAELRVLDRSVEADQTLHELGGRSELHQDLRTLRQHRDEQVTRLVDALRELHLGFARRSSAPPVVREEVISLLDQLDAEREVDALRPASDAFRRMHGQPRSSRD
ncbi:MAG: hypothetical protein CL927_01900 [Deltaproteobacteria bacterium]|nr:hypothetical protein [Deltaproteobacteria bacterium]